MTPSFSRREFLHVSALAAGGMMITLRTPGAVASPLPKATDTVMGPYLKIFSDGLVEIGGPVPELGQGVHTSLPMILNSDTVFTGGLVSRWRSMVLPFVSAA